MTGLDGRRVYLDWNATAPLRPEAREAMLAAMDAVGNPSSVHAEGRAARAIVERARGQVATLVGCEPDAVVFTSGATEAAEQAAEEVHPLVGSDAEHDCVRALATPLLAVGRDGIVRLEECPAGHRIALQAANSETGVVQPLAARRLGLQDAVQAIGKSHWRFAPSAADFAIVSAHKIGGPKGVGALLNGTGAPVRSMLTGGGQERGQRGGTENVVGIAGFGAAAEAARRDLAAGLWDGVAELRNILESELEAAAPDLTIVGRGVPRLPNTSCFAVPGWKGETQVMALDLAGFAVSAGSACSSGKVAESRVLRAMGYDAETALSAIRVSLGPTTTEAEVMAFVAAWKGLHAKRARRAALAG